MSLDVTEVDGEGLGPKEVNGDGRIVFPPPHAGWVGIWPVALMLIALTVGIVIGRGWPDSSTVKAADATPDATAVREAELVELNDLRTQVSQPGYCTLMPTPSPTSTPEPTATATIVPAQVSGTEVVDSSGLGITVLSIQPVTTPEGIEASGRLMRVNVSFSNPTDSPIQPPFVTWRLVDAAGNRYAVHLIATGAIAGPTWAVAIGAHENDERSVVFDVAPDAGTSFVLENNDDPNFRIEVVIESRG
jgi:hypothetical protein